MRRVRYRLGQFLSSLWALFFPPDDVTAQCVLSAQEYALFRHMARYDRTHALRVLRRLEDAAVDNVLLRKAALLHDAGKSAGHTRIPLLYRGAIVIARHHSRLWGWLAQPRPTDNWLYPFHLYATHAARGAELARAANCPEEVIAMIAAHHDEDVEGPLKSLQETDRIS